LSPSRLTALALGLAATALLVAAYSSYLSCSSGSRPQPVAASSTSNAELEAELAAVRTKLDAVERRLATAERNLLLATRPNVDDEPDVAGLDADRESADGDEHRSEREFERQTTPEFVDFEIAESGLDIRQNDNGSLSVRNSNPALANQIVTVKARGQDGRVYDLPITVPPVE